MYLFQEPTPSGTYVVVLLILAPFIGTLINSIYELLGRGEISPVLPKLVSYSFGQAFFAIAVSVAFPVEPVLRGFAVVTLISMIVIVALQAYLDANAKKSTQTHIQRVLQTKVQLKAGVDRDLLRELANSLVDVDFIPGSIPNVLSGLPRKARREQLAQLINGYLTEPGHNPLTERDFLLEENEIRRLRRTYAVANLFAVGLYLLSVVLSNR
jgi:hypothetical protein